MSINKQLQNSKGFTLIELMVVIAILGVLAAIAIPKVSDSITLAKTAKLQADLHTIATAVAMYEADTGKLPTGDLEVALVPSSGKRYLQTMPVPPELSVPATYKGGYDAATGVVTITFQGKSYKSDGSVVK